MWNTIVEWFDSTHLVQQITEVDYAGLFTNPWFLVPFCILVAYLIYRQSWKDLAIILARMIPTVLFPDPGMPISTILDFRRSMIGDALPLLRLGCSM